MFLPVLCLRQGYNVVCQRVRRVYQFVLWGTLGLAFFLGFFASLWCFVQMESASLAGVPVVYNDWVTLVCLLLDTPFGRRSVGAVTFVTSGENA